MNDGVLLNRMGRLPAGSRVILKRHSCVKAYKTCSINGSADITEMLKSKVNNWKASQPLFIHALSGDLCWEN